MYEKFELTLPFVRINIKTFEACVQRANAACGSESFVTIAALSDQLATPAWDQLKQGDSKLSKVLLSKAFKNE